MSRWPCLGGLIIGLMICWRAAAGAEPPHHRVDLRLDPDAGQFIVTDQIRLSEGGPISFELAPGLLPGEVTLDGAPVAVAAKGERYRSETRARSGQILAISYRFKVGQTPDPDHAFLDAGWGWLPAGTGWLPRVQPGPVSFDVTLEVPAPLVAVATGDLVHEERTGDLYRARFVSPRPGEPPSVFAGRYEIGEMQAGDLRVRTYFPSPAADLASLYQERASRYIRWFEERIGAYPYAGFAVVAAPLPVGLGFAGLTYVSERILPLPFMQSRSLAHEILHTWWGNAVEVEYRDGNWAEGLTTYMADYGLAAGEGEAAAEAMRLEWLRDYNALPGSEDAPLAAFVARSHDASQVVGYNKAAFLFHMLERRLGQERFQAGLQDVFARHLGGTASWSDLRASFERVAAQDLTTFFDQWLTRTGAPDLRLAEVERSKAGPQWQVQVTLAQEPPAYALRVPVEVRTVAGDETALVRLTGERAGTTIRTSAEPLAIAVDPEVHLFRRLAPGEAPPIMRDVTLDPRTAVVLAGGAGETGAALAEAMLGRPPEMVAADRGRADGRPLIMISVGAAAVLPEPPAALAGRGTARAWTVDGAQPVFVVQADDQAALEALRRPLPHYRRSSFLVFDGADVIEQGVWPAGDSALVRSFR